MGFSIAFMCIKMLRMLVNVDHAKFICISCVEKEISKQEKLGEI